MAQSIRVQALFLLLAAGLGAGLGLLYDLLRPLRRRTNDALWDLLFCLAAALAGFLLYVHALSPSVAPVLERLTRGIGSIWIFMGGRLKKIL